MATIPWKTRHSLNKGKWHGMYGKINRQPENHAGARRPVRCVFRHRLRRDLAKGQYHERQHDSRYRSRQVGIVNYDPRKEQGCQRCAERVDDVVTDEYRGDQRIIAFGKLNDSRRPLVALFRHILDADAVE